MSEYENSYFNKALSDFVNDFASGDAIRHLSDKGYTVDEIAEKLDYPVPRDIIRNTVWKHLISEGIIRLDKPCDDDRIGRVSYVRERNAYGRISFRQVTEYDDSPAKECVACDFGREIYKDKAGFEKKLEALDKRDRAYIEGLPWPLETVYHIKDERMARIMEKLETK